MKITNLTYGKMWQISRDNDNDNDDNDDDDDYDNDDDDYDNDNNDDRAARTPDNPLSLYEGWPGTVCFLTDLLFPNQVGT